MTRRRHFAPAREGDGGFVLIAVLWILAALATLASVYSVYALNTAAASRVPDERLQAEMAIRAGVELAAFQVLALPPASRPTKGAFAAKLGGSKIEVGYLSESARVDLNAAPKALLAGLFAAVGAGAASETYAARVEGWRKTIEPNAPNEEEKAYVTAGVPYRPRQAPFVDTLELTLVRGLPPAMAERVLPYVTVFSGAAQIDVANADPQVLAALPGVTPDVLNKVLEARQKAPGDGKAILALLGPAQQGATIAPNDALRAVIGVTLPRGRRIQAEVVFKLVDVGDKPFDIVFWRDSFDAPL